MQWRKTMENKCGKCIYCDPDDCFCVQKDSVVNPNDDACEDFENEDSPSENDDFGYDEYPFGEEITGYDFEL